MLARNLAQKAFIVWLLLAQQAAIRALLTKPGRPETDFLHEILMGRCYYRSPKGQDHGPAECPPLVGTLMGGFEGKRDSDITTTDFESYLNVADFSAPKDSGLFWIADPESNNDENSGTPGAISMTNFVQPENTPGGALVDDLSFCGNDERNHCPGVVSPRILDDGTSLWKGAESALWAGIYEQFAAGLTGRVTIGMSPNASEESPAGLLTTLAAIPQMNPASVTEVQIFIVGGSEDNTSCDKAAFLKAALANQGIHQISCTQDPYSPHAFLCADRTGVSVGCQHIKSFESGVTSGDQGGKTTSPNAESGSTSTVTELGEMQSIDDESTNQQPVDSRSPGAVYPTESKSGRIRGRLHMLYIILSIAAVAAVAVLRKKIFAKPRYEIIPDDSQRGYMG